MDLIIILKLSGIIGLLNLDNKNIVSIGLARPIVTGTICGLLLNNLYYGIFLGCIIELILINLLPIGAFIPPNGTIITGIAIIISYYFHAYKSGILIPVILIYAILWGHLTKRISRLLWKRNSILVENFLKNAQQDKFYFNYYNIIVIVSDFFIYSIITFIGSICGIYTVKVINKLFLRSYFIQIALENAVYFLPLFILVYVLNSFDLSKKITLILVGIVSAFLLTLVISSPILIVLIIGVLSYIALFSIHYYREHYYEL